MEIKTALLLTLAVFMLAIAFSSIFTLISMLNQSKAITAVICILMAFSLLFIGAQLNKSLNEPETNTGMAMTENGMETQELPNPKYLDEETCDKLLSRLFEDYQKLESSNTRFKELLIEEILTANYEILILSGERIPRLVEMDNTEQTLTALSKAVYNMYRDDIRESRDYFENEKDAVFYDCLTANQKVNKKIIEMKGIKSISI